MSDVFFHLADLQAAENATVEDAQIRLKAIKHYVRAWLGDDDINENVKYILEVIGIDVGDPWSVVIGYPFALAILKKAHKCEGRKCVLKVKKKTASKLEKIKKEKMHEKKREEKKSANQAKQGRGICIKKVQARKYSSKNVSSSSEDESSVKFFKPPIHYI